MTLGYNASRIPLASDALALGPPISRDQGCCKASRLFFIHLTMARLTECLRRFRERWGLARAEQYKPGGAFSMKITVHGRPVNAAPLHHL